MVKDMRKVVEEGYDKGDYTSAYRMSKEPNKMEKFFLDKLIKLIPKNANVLDLGSGPGIPIDNYLVDKGIKITGIDISQNHVNLAKKNVPKAKFIKGDFSKYDFDEKFDAIISFYAIFHIPREEHQDLFLKIYDLLNDGGIILVTLGTSGTKYGEEDWAGTTMAWSTYEPEEYKKMIKEAGFKILQTEFEGEPGDEEYHFWVLAKK
jgi:cyclopropane fatty-acyl-phospholipid synthase-like methyltransferase